MAPPLRVSIIIPAYQASAYAGDALKSVFSQTYRNFEVILVNDHSPDTPELERVIAPYQGQIQYLRHLDGNKGPAATRNTAIAAATGDLLAFLDADDMWLAEFLERQVAAFSRDPALDLLWCDAICVGDASVAGRRYMELNAAARPVTVLALLTARSVPLTSCTVVRRGPVIAVGGFDERFWRAEDYDLYLRLANAGYKLDFQRLVLGKRRIRKGSLTSNVAEFVRADIAVCEKLSSAISATDPLQFAIRGQIRKFQRSFARENACSSMEAGDFPRAAAAYREANAGRHQPVLALFIVVLERCPVFAFRGWRLHRKLLSLGRMLRRLMIA